MPAIEKRISSGSRFEEMAAYSRALVDDRYIYISGTVGSDPVTQEMPADVEAQTRNIFTIIERVLAEQGAGLAQIVRSRVFLVDVADLGMVVPVLKEKFGDFPPTNTTLLCGIPAPGAKVEIEVTALRR
jgi:enamine deaminase RidA (YjgF/YER057c/UK114 family)